MKKIHTFLSVLVLVFLFTGMSNATGLFTEDFTSNAGTLITAAGWTAHSGAGTNAITVTTTGGASGLSYTDYANSNKGLSVTLATSGEDDHVVLSSPVSSGSVYAAAMIKVTSAQTGDYFFHFGSSSSSFCAKLYVKSTTGGYFFGVQKAAETAVYESTVRALGTTYLVVLKYTYNTGTSTDDVVSLFVNPTLASEPATPTLATTGGTDFGSILWLYLRQGASGSMPVVAIDGINVGTTWTDAVPTSGSNPTFSATGTLTAFSQTSASASAEQTYTIGGTNLTNTVTVTPPAGFEISKTTGSGFVNNTSNLTFTAAQVMANPTIYVRLHAASSGSYSGNITHASSDFTTVNQAASGSYPGFTVTGALTAFSQTSASASAEQTYTIGGTNLTNTVTITPPSGFEISKTTGSGFVNSTGNLSFTAAQVMANPTIYVRLHAATQGSYSGNITHAGSDFVTVNQAASGTYTIPVNTLSLTALIQGRFDGSTMVSDTVTVELFDAGSFALVDQNKGVLSASGTGTFSFSNAVNGTNYYIAVKHRNSIETWSASAYSFTSYALSYNFTTAAAQAYGSNLILQGSKYCIYTGDVNQDGAVDGIDLSSVDNDNNAFVSGYTLTDLNGDGVVDGRDLGIVDNNNSAFISKNVPAPVTPTPVLTITGTLTAFSQTSASASAEQTYSISGTALTANVTLVPPSGFEISKTTGTGFVTSSGSLVYSAANVMAGQTIYVRLHAASTGSYSGNITHTSANSEFTQGTKSVSGAYTITPVFSVTGTLASFSQTSSTPSAEQTYGISGTGLTANVTVVPPAGFEISKTTGTGFVNSTGSLVYTAANIMAGQTIYVRLNAASTGSYSGNITHTSASSEFTVQNQSVSGSYTVISSNVNLIMGYPAPATTDVNNPHAFLLAKDVFCASYDRDRGIPNWTSWQLNSTWCNGPGVRQDNYIPDPSLPSGWYHVSGTDYSGSGFSRGHMCPSADRLNTQNNNDSLFYYTNMVPQNQDNNAGDWEGLETYERTLANAGNTLYIVSGGYGSGGKVLASTGDTTTHYTISGGKVTVPAQLWKVIIVVPNGDGTAADVSKVTTSTRTIGMIIPNTSVPNSTSTWGNYRVSVASIEALTGYTFFSNVPSSIGNVIKATVDKGPTN